MLFGIGAMNNGFVEIYTSNWIVNVINILLLFGILFQTTYLVSILIGKKQYFTVIEVMPSRKESSGFMLGKFFNLKRKYFYVINEKHQKFVVSSFFAIKERVFEPDEKIRGYKGFGNKVKMIDRKTILMRIGVLIVWILLLSSTKNIFQWLKII